MAEYVLISNGERSVITAMFPTKDFPDDEWSTRSDWIEAPSWLAAKQALGFELTPLQRQLLGKIQ